MKKILTILLTVIMLLGVIAVNTSAEATEPSVTIVTNEGSAVDKDDSIYITVKFNDFESIAGMDVIVTSDTKGVLETVEEVTGFDITAQKDKNYTVNKDGDKIRFVDLTGGVDGKIVIKAKAPEKTAAITVSGKYAENGKELFKENLTVNKNLEVKAEVKENPLTNATSNPVTITPNSGKFVPYGAVYKYEDGKYTFADKKSASTFEIKKGNVTEYSYKEFDLPDADTGITTYGVSEDPTRAGNLRFGSYSATGASNHGTMVFEGNWLELKNYYIKNGLTVQECVEAIYESASSLLETNKDKKFVYYTIPTTGEQINVYLFPQNNYMWKDGNVLEFAVRLSGIKENTQYAAVAYSVNGNTVKISDTVKSKTITTSNSQ